MFNIYIPVPNPALPIVLSKSRVQSDTRFYSA